MKKRSEVPVSKSIPKPCHLDDCVVGQLGSKAFTRLAETLTVGSVVTDQQRAWLFDATRYAEHVVDDNALLRTGLMTHPTKQLLEEQLSAARNDKERVEMIVAWVQSTTMLPVRELIEAMKALVDKTQNRETTDGPALDPSTWKRLHEMATVFRACDASLEWAATYYCPF